MTQFIYCFLLILTSLAAAAQKSGPADVKAYEAANWKIRLLDTPEKLTTAAPPSSTQTKKELALLKSAMKNLDEKKLAAIKYWDAGAPSYRWNGILPGLVQQKQDVQLRMPASWMNLAIYDATILAWKEKLRHKRSRPHQMDADIKPLIIAPATYAYPCEHSVTAAAAATVLAYFFPAKADSIMQMARAAAQSRIDAGVQLQSDVDAGWQLGEQVGKAIVEKAKNDGSAKVWDGKMNKDITKWTGPYPLGITLASFTPLVIESSDQFRVPPPPDFKKEMEELKNFKQSFKTAAQAYYWANTGESWTELAGLKMFENRMMSDAPAVARVYAVLTSAYHDMAIAVMDSKYAYWGIRPNQYDSTYKPLIPTPPFPGYPSGHAAGAAGSSAVMEYFFPADAKQFRRLAQECADSRFYAGIHFKIDNEEGLKLGRAVGSYVVTTWMKD